MTTTIMARAVLHVSRGRMARSETVVRVVEDVVVPGFTFKTVTAMLGVWLVFWDIAFTVVRAGRLRCSARAVGSGSMTETSNRTCGGDRCEVEALV